MKWRLVQDLNLDVLREKKCLLFGAGTLGCNIARGLLSWGISRITFVDNGKVSHSNPVRQSLYTSADVGQPKAVTAAKAIRAVFESAEAEGVDLDIPMPGHYMDSELLQENTRKLDALVQGHDVLFLLTDSRESRWFPTLLGSVYDKLVITVALGFDDYVVLRHGNKDQKTSKLGCYFCPDSISPYDTVTNRSLDQQCTISRPGLSHIASGIAVESLAAFYQQK